MARSDRDFSANDLGGVFAHWRRIERPAMWFVLANFLDAAMTYIVLRHGNPSGHEFVEGNRIAAWFFDGWGHKGLFGFKLANVAFVCAIAYIIAISNVSVARRVLQFGTLVVVAVVFYSIWLYTR